MPQNKPRKRNYRKKRPTIKTLSQKVNKLIRAPELKNYDRSLTSYEIDQATIDFVCISNIDKGTANGQRVGDNINVKAINISIDDPTGMRYDATTRIRFWVIQDKQANGSTPTWDEVFSYNTIGSFVNRENIERFKILTSGEISSNDGDDFNDATHLHLYKKCNIKLQYNDGTAGTSADCNKNTLWLAFRPDVYNSEYEPTIDVLTRIIYTDQ